MAALLTQGALRPVARREGHIITQGQQPMMDGVDQGLVVTTREIGPANAAGKQHITHKGVARARVKKDHVARRMAGAMANFKRAAAERDGRAPARPRRLLRS